MPGIKNIAFTVAFAGASTAALLVGAATNRSGPAGFPSFAATAALADEEGDRGDHGGQDCVNPAGHERGWCKHGGENGDREGGYRKHHKHHRGGNGANTTISGTVLSVNGNTAQVRLDDGRVITVNEAGTALSVGQHYSLNGCYQNGTFVVNCNGYGGGTNGSGYGQQQVSGTIISVSGNIVTLAALPPVRIDIGQARANGQIFTSLSPATHITAYGYQSNGTFYATSVR